jgi:TatD DNase family protein
MAADVAGTLRRAAAHGVEHVVHIGCSSGAHDPAIALAEQHPEVFVTIGIHPHEAKTLNEGMLARMADLARHPRVVAVGEIGLDFHYDRSPRPRQLEAFALQIELARRLDMPMVIHVREADDRALDVLRAHPPRERDPGVVHCFSAGPAEARLWLDRGFCLSFSGIVTFPGAHGVREAAQLCPADRLLVETDAPYLTPVPNRGRPNEPAYVAFVCAELARVLGRPAADVALRAARATRSLFRLGAAR